MSVETKRFSLVLDIETFREWRTYFNNHGDRQRMLRKAVKLMIHQAKLKMGEQPKRPYWIPVEVENGVTFEEALKQLLEKEMEEKS